MRSRAQLDAVFEYMRPDERYGLLADEHAEEAKKSDRGRCRRSYLNKPIYDSDCYAQDNRSEIRSHRCSLAKSCQREHLRLTTDLCKRRR